MVVYFIKLKKCWDDLYILNEILVCFCGKLKECICGIAEKFFQIEGRNKLVYFLMRLNDDFKGVRSQILSMDLLSSVNRVFYIV